MDSGLWITWYDLPVGGRDEHLAWVHDEYIPSILRRPGVLWGAHYATVREPFPPHVRHTDDPAVPPGIDYILIFGAETASSFFAGSIVDGSPSGLHADRSEEDLRMLASRIGERTNIMVEAGRVDGQSSKGTMGGDLGPFIQLGTYNCAWQDEVEMQGWYAQARMPAMAETPGGGIRVRKLVSASGWAKHGILYEFESLEAKHEYFALHRDRPDMKPWLSWVTRSLVHAPGSATHANRIWPAVER